MAGWFGKHEHNAGRLLGLELMILLVLGYFVLYDGYAGIVKWGLYYPFIFRKSLFVLIILTFLTWAIYISSHTLEKKLYGNQGFR